LHGKLAHANAGHCCSEYLIACESILKVHNQGNINLISKLEYYAP